MNKRQGNKKFCPIPPSLNFTDNLVSIRNIPANYLSSSQILLVEDNLINIMATQLLLARFGYKNTTTAVTGAQALALFSPKYDLVILDIGLPDISGTEVCQKMRELLGGKTIPIIACTAFGTSIKDNCLEAGMDDCLIKPLEKNKFRATMERWLITARQQKSS